MAIVTRTRAAGMLCATLMAAAAASRSAKRRKPAPGKAHPTRPGTVASNAKQVPHSYRTSASGMTRQILGRMEPLTGTEIVDRIHRLMTLRSRIDRLAWNSLAGSLQGPPSPKVQDWDDRCMMLVSIGMAFEDMPEVLEQALADPEGLSAWGSMIHRTAEAYDSLSLAYVPATWSEHSAAGGGLSDSCMWNAWTALCDEVAAIIGHEPGYGRNVVCTKPKG